MRSNPSAPVAPPALPPRHSLARSVALFRAFRVEQSDPDRFYSLLAADTVREVGSYVGLAGARVLDVGGGPGYFADAFRAAGARYAGIDPDVGELNARGDAPEGFVRASGMRLPLADAGLDVALSSNVLEHVPRPEQMAAELLRVVRPGGLVWLSWTTWLSPWGGHETAPWHYLGGRRAADRYARRHGHRPKNDFGRSLFACSAARMSRWARHSPLAEVVDIRPRYHPGWAGWVAQVPALREVASWNLVIVMRRR
jgi:SAM-dependent methyltransferase